MFAILKRLGFVIFWETIALLLLLVTKPDLYIAWLIFCFVFLFFLFYVSAKIIPTKREKKRLKELSVEYQEFMSKNFDIKTQANLLDFTCPSCEHTTNFWEFINENECPKCGSKLWTTKIMDKGKEYYDIFLESEKLDNFLSRLTFRQKNRLKKMMAGI